MPRDARARLPARSRPSEAVKGLSLDGELRLLPGNQGEGSGSKDSICIHVRDGSRMAKKRSASVYDSPAPERRDAQNTKIRGKLGRAGTQRSAAKSIGIGGATFDCSNHNNFSVAMQSVNNAKVANPSAENAAQAMQKLSITLKWVVAHQAESAGDFIALWRRKFPQLPLGRISDCQAPFHFSNLRAS